MFGINADGTFPDIGQRYDVGVGTRDGTTLACLNKDGQTVHVSRIAYMFSTDKQNKVKESTELQEKSKLVQLGTSNSIDREFDQWPQNTQGDWSAGTGQRVYGQQGVTNAYFDGEGLLWPLNDWIPQKAMPGPVVVDNPANFNGTSVFADVVGGYLAGAGNGYGYILHDTTTHLVPVFRSGDQLWTFAAWHPDTTKVLAMFIAMGSWWVVTYAGTTITVESLTVLGVGSLTSSLNGTVLNTHPQSAVCTAGLIGNKAYVAVGYTPISASEAILVTIFDFSAGGAPAVTTMTFPAAAVATVPAQMVLTDLNFQGSTLVMGLSDGFNVSVVTAAAPFTAFATVAVLPGLSNVLFTSVGSTLFLIGYSTSSSGVNRMDLYTLIGGSLTEIGPINFPVALLLNVTSPTSFGGYAFWTVRYKLPNSNLVTTSVYAFDVVRTRLFRTLTFTNSAFTGSAALVHDGVAIFGTTNRTLVAGATFSAQFGIAINTQLVSGAVENAREFYWGVQPLTPVPTFNGLLQMGVDIISGLFDFTAASNKRWRAKVAHIFGGLLAGLTSPSVTINAWFNQDPGRLNPAPDFTVTTGALPAPIPSQVDLYLFEGQVARQSVYELISASTPLESGAGAIAYSSLGTFFSSASQRTITLTGGAAVGDLVVAVLESGTNTFDLTSVITDSKGNVWTVDAVQFNAAGNGGGLIGHSVLSVALAVNDTITVQTKNAGVNVNNLVNAISVIRITGLNSASITAIVDQSSSAIGNTAAPAAGALSLGLVPEAVIGAAGIAGSAVLTPSAGWTAIGRSTDGVNADLQPLYQTFAAAGTSNAGGTYPGAHQWAALQVAFTDTTWVNAPKIKDLVVMIAAPMVWDFVVDISPRATTNGQAQNEYCYTSQTTTEDFSIDHVVAYNFLKQLWEARGGVCQLYLPNGQTLASLMQEAGLESPKPLGAGYRSDQQASWQVTGTLKVREDV